ncbi:zeta toxin family protein [Campylobacter sp. RM12640]|uniref:zeta toxin family protein n=1 Tax=unclassified Campylobacter TaxID=2593542 RepID=UPI001DB4B199|nr:zeta toxin family protein [Campylobacter sp. RM12642]MBZ7982440.1 zeta toxin family protein [Campylobacter sp. RM12640]MBZ7990054.1 zeta toxin family protein [Campylobacter sp. RM12635]MBZ8008242.1 zeta toxin family protein [Campylobacter sp. RM9334]
MKIDENIFNVIWSDVKKDYITPVNNYKAFVLGGQPGAGKSKLIKLIEQELNSNVIVINGDDYRKYHPNYANLQATYGKDSPKHTAEFAGMITEMILDKAIKNKLNIVIEGTFRTATTPIKTLKLFKDNGYNTNVLIQTCHKDISWKSCLERYEKMLETNPNEARFTDKVHHDIVVDNLANNIKEVQKSGLVDNMKIYSRILDKKTGMFNQVEIYNSDLKPKVNIATINKYLGLERKLNLENLYNFD